MKALVPTSATVSKVMISLVPSRFAVIAAIDKPAHFGQRQHAVVHTKLRLLQSTCSYDKFEFCANNELKPRVSLNP